MEVVRHRVAVLVGEALAYQPGPHHLAAGIDERAVRLVAEGDLADGPDGDGIGPAQEHHERHGDLEGREQLAAQHQRTPKATITMSMSLMPMKGAITPPMP